jgi:two-component system nitrate/nitrite sensor histidine kinase NarX
MAARSLAHRLAAASLVFLACAVASISLSLWVTWQLEGGAAAVNEAGRLRMLTYRMTLDVATGRRGELAPQMETFERTLELLRTGDPSRPLAVPASDETRAEFAHVGSLWTQYKASLGGSTGQPDVEGATLLVGNVDKLVGAIELRMDYWTTVLRFFQLVLLALSVAAAIALLYVGHMMVLEPLRRVGAAIGALRKGNLGARVESEATIEFQELADGFNSMAERIGLQYSHLEEAVRNKTADLRAQRERLEALYEVSDFVAKAESLDEMAKGFVAKVRRIARADAIALRWSDAENRRYHLLAQEGLPPSFAAQEQCLPTGDCHCGQAFDAAKSRVIPIRASAVPRDHCSKAGFETVLTVPVALNHRVHGEIDLFYRTPFSATDPVRSLVELLASHLAGGMQGLRAAAADKEAAVSNERGLLAQELHDSIAQSLAFLKIQVQLLRAAVSRDDKRALSAVVDEIEVGVKESYGDVRELLVHFRTRADSEEIEPALRTTLLKFHMQTGVATDIEVAGHGVALPNDVQVQVLHIVQEALSNIRKHARASSVRLRVTQSPTWRFEVTDDGLGFDATASAGVNHVGLRIMTERARRIGGELSVKSTEGRGTTITLALPPVSTASKDDEHALADSTACR